MLQGSFQASSLSEKPDSTLLASCYILTPLPDKVNAEQDALLYKCCTLGKGLVVPVQSLTSRQNSLSDLPAGPMHNSLQLFPDEVLRVEGMMGREQAVGSAPPLLLCFLLVTLSKGPETHPSPFLSRFF